MDVLTFEDQVVQVADRNISAYLTIPTEPGPFPAIVVVHEWWGLTDYVRGVAQDLSQQGFVAIAPDLYHGHLGLSVDRAMTLSKACDPQGAVADLLAVIAFLRTLPSVGSQPVGMIGFCMGGSLTLETAMATRALAAIAPFYPGRVGQACAHLEAITAPMFVAFGADDPSIPPALVEQFQQTVRTTGKTAEIRVYQGAKHAFHNATGMNFHPTAAADAWAGALAFFREHLVQA